MYPYILTDRDPCFSNIDGIMQSCQNNKKRLKIFYCDPYVSSQKPNVEILNKQLRIYFPKSKSADNYTHKYVFESWKILIDTPRRTLDGFTPREAFIKVFEEEILEKLIKIIFN